MPRLTPNLLVIISTTVLLISVLYKNGLPDIQLPNLIIFQIARAIFSDTYCYVSVKTLSNKLPHAECFTVRNGRFTRVFLDETSFDVTKEQRTGHVIPGLWDGHGHLMQYGELMDSVNLFGADSMKEVKKRLVDYKTQHPEAGTSEQWLRGVGWDQANFGGKWPKAADLEIGGQFKDLYVMLDRVDVHCIWVSPKVLSLLPLPIPEVPGGDIPAMGIFCDNAMDLVLEHYPKPSSERRAKFLKDAMWDLNKLGVVGMHDAGVFPSELKLYEELADNEDWTVRVYAMMECEKRNTFCPEDAVKISRDDGKLSVRSVKLFGDGALGSWGSAMIEPYSDHPSTTGSLLVNATTLTELAIDWAKAGYQVNIHAIGDLANRLAIDAMSSALDAVCPGITRAKCQAERRFRIEHSQIIHPDDQKRMREIGIIPSIQPTHATSDMHYAESRLGKERTSKEAYLMKSLLPLNPVLGSDFPVEPANPFEGIYAAMTRRSPRTGLDKDGGKTGWYPEETLTLEEALRGFTVAPAYAAFMEGKAGTIQPGAYADWVVLDEPLEDMDPEKIKNIKVRETWVGGKRVWRKPGPIDIRGQGEEKLY
ncbi:hypothetical protein GQ43DRAFT_52041 [Delitschia confertaspora ATCC 74209]|uniref:Amidohydrolase 3 domain-containing protein n=1 Tax=Delitschia confertaspora ATCC 74209 TaxID=1513339 RepID=A0A9P4JKA5_9PLEO|nr:hypothetical protein GQ43DRAFT_52041 [Delitschia confertaspora ATCC 74209]